MHKSKWNRLKKSTEESLYVTENCTCCCDERGTCKICHHLFSITKCIFFKTLTLSYVWFNDINSAAKNEFAID